MHSAARLLINRLGHESCGPAFCGSRIFYDIFCDHGFISHVHHFSQLHFDFQLAGASHLVMMVFYTDSPILHEHTHFASQIIGNILGRGDVIAALMLHLISQVAGIRKAGIPFGLPGIHRIGSASGRYLIVYGIKKIKFKLRPDRNRIRRAGLFHILCGPQRHVSRILVEGPVFIRSYDTHIPCHGKCGDFREGIDHRAVRIGNKNHIAFFDGRIAIIGTVEPYPLCKNTVSKALQRYGNMPPSAIQIHHFKVNHTNAVFSAQLQHFFTLPHKKSPLSADSSRIFMYMGSRMDGYVCPPFLTAAVQPYFNTKSPGGKPGLSL